MRLSEPLPSSPLLLVLTAIVAGCGDRGADHRGLWMTLAPWDPGLQNERTGLAWQRTMLAGLTCSLLVARLLASISILLAVIIGLLALLCTAGLGWWRSGASD